MERALLSLLTKPVISALVVVRAWNDTYDHIATVAI